MKNIRLLFTLAIAVCLFSSCAKTDKEELDSAKQSAKYYLTGGDCSDARDALEDVGYQSDDAVYISLLAASHACDADYSELDLFADLSSISSSAGAMLGSLTLFSTSNETEPDSDVYTSLMEAIDTIIESGGGSASGRNSKFGSVGGTNLNFQALYMILVELGKFMELYADAQDGEKGGKGNHTCFFTYTVADAKLYVGSSGSSGACVSSAGGEGSPYLPGPATDTTTQARLCEGIYLFNNLRDILANVEIGDDSSFGSLKDISPALETAIETAEALDSDGRISAVSEVFSKEACLDLSAEELEVWYAVLFETAMP